MNYRMKNLTSIIIFLFVCQIASTQDRALYTQYNLNPALINPAYSGFVDDYSMLSFNYRNRWSSFPGSPHSYTFNYHTPVGDRLGLGATIFSENIASINRFRAQLAYAYKFRVDKYKVAIGLTTEYEKYSIDNGTVTNPFFDADDNLLLDAIEGIAFFDATFGIYADYEDKFFFGISFPNLIRARLTDVLNAEESDESGLYYNIFLGYRYKVNNYDLVLEPSILVKDLRYQPFQVDLNLKANFLNDQLVGGITYSVGAGSRFGVLVGTNINKFSFNYSYDASFEEFQQYNNGAHEITIGIKIDSKRQAVIQKTDQ